VPVACNSNALTGSSGAVYYVPAGTKACLLAADFDSTGDTIQVSANNDFRVGDSVVFSVTGSATLDSGLTAGDTYLVSAISADYKVTVTEASGAAVTIAGDGTDGTGHVEMKFLAAKGICEVREWSIEYAREQLDVTTLPCTVGASAGGAKWAATKKFQGGFAEITGTLTLYITNNETSLANRLMESVHLNIQDGAKVMLYMDAVSDGAASPQPDDAASTLIAGSVQLTDFSTSVNPDDPTQAEISFSMFDVTHWIGQSI
tara:strand:+ start:10412 stop:11191 length:780 start_codon:yes stop_codon:yes gene_type:complete